jgi:hypothetical protein
LTFDLNLILKYRHRSQTKAVKEHVVQIEPERLPFLHAFLVVGTGASQHSESDTHIRTVHIRECNVQVESVCDAHFWSAE